MAHDLFNCIILLYVIPTIICVCFTIIHNKDNPFKKHSDAHQYVFMPLVNVACALIIVYYVCIELVVRFVWKWLRKKYKEFEKWNKE